MPVDEVGRKADERQPMLALAERSQRRGLSPVMADHVFSQSGEQSMIATGTGVAARRRRELSAHNKNIPEHHITITAPGFPYSLCLFSIRFQLTKPYRSLAKNITKQATIGTLEMSEIAAITHSTISTRSLAA